MKRLGIYYAIFAVVFCYLSAQTDAPADGQCVACHKLKSPGLYGQWLESAHGRNDVTCIDCHQADQKDRDAYLHEGAWIATLVTPRDCGACHESETREVSESYHAHAGEILESADAYLAHVAGGHPAAIAGCESCHGANVKIDPDSPNKLHKQSWPNSGIGRLNPDGSKGACNACHTRHSFSIAQARQPESCAKCHLGPDHPQKEIYDESKHGNTYYTNKDKMNLSNGSWVVGKDYHTAPTCATCHMSATGNQRTTHDVGLRLRWTLRPPVSKPKESWDVKRKNMTDVCLACHGNRFVAGHFYQFDALVHLYNEKFAKPAGAIMRMIKQKNLLENPANFGNELEWMYWELWHHEGRRARHGAAMMGPDYTWWHGMYEVAHTFYFKFLEEAKKLNDSDVNHAIEDLLNSDPMHRWLKTATPDLKKAIRSGEMQSIYKKLFEKKEAR